MIKTLFVWVSVFLIVLAFLYLVKVVFGLKKNDIYTLLKLAAFAAISATVTTLFLSLIVILF